MELLEMEQKLAMSLDEKIDECFKQGRDLKMELYRLEYRAVARIAELERYIYYNYIEIKLTIIINYIYSLIDDLLKDIYGEDEVSIKKRKEELYMSVEEEMLNDVEYQNKLASIRREREALQEEEKVEYERKWQAIKNRYLQNQKLKKIEYSKFILI